MAETYAKYMRKAGIEFPSKAFQESIQGGSTDMGNVSYAVPTIHPMYSIHTQAANHTIEFTEAAGTPVAHEDTIRASKALAMAAAHVLVDEVTFQAVKSEYQTLVPKEYR